MHFERDGGMFTEMLAHTGSIDKGVMPMPEGHPPGQSLSASESLGSELPRL
jgi:hypothetical protein